MTDDQIEAMCIMLVAISGRPATLTMGQARELVRAMVEAPNGPFGAKAETVPLQQVVECAFCEQPMIAGSECSNADQAAACEMRSQAPASS